MGRPRAGLPVPATKSDRNTASEVVKRLITEAEWENAVRSLWEIATSGTRPEWAYCPHCSTKVLIDRVDLRARVDATAKLQELGFGRPKPADDDRAPMVLNRVIVRPEEKTPEEPLTA